MDIKLNDLNGYNFLLFTLFYNWQGIDIVKFNLKLHPNLSKDIYIYIIFLFYIK